MKRVYEFSTWLSSPEWKEAERKAIEAAKQHDGEKFTVAIGEWGVRTFLVLTDTKEEAKELAVDYFKSTNGNPEALKKIRVKNVTNAKKYN